MCENVPQTPVATEDDHIPGVVRGMVGRIADTLGVASLAGMVEIDGRTAVTEAITEFTTGALDELRLCLPRDGRGSQVTDVLWRTDQVRDGTHVRAIVEPGLPDAGHALGVAGRAAGGSVELRAMTDLPIEVIITDHHRALLVLGASEAVAMNGSALLFDILLDCFENLWLASAPANHGALADPADTSIDEDDRALLVLMARGLTDRAIARKLSLSTRTVQRRIHELMQRLGTESRFQAGISAAAKGWI